MGSFSTNCRTTSKELYFKAISECCVDADEAKRAEGLNNLASEPGVRSILSELSIFILEGVRWNIAQQNVAVLNYLMDMVNSLLLNATVDLTMHLHHFVAAVMSCVVCKHMCVTDDRHWALRDLSCQLIGTICKSYHTTTNQLQMQISRLYCQCLADAGSPLTTFYGALAGLCALGPLVIDASVVANIRFIGDRIKACLDPVDGCASGDHAAALRVQQLTVKVAAPLLVLFRQPPDILDDYLDQFGYLGAALQDAVLRERGNQILCPPEAIEYVEIRDDCVDCCNDQLPS